MAFKVKEIKDPVFEVDFGDGNIKSFDPWKTQEMIQDDGVKNPEHKMYQCTRVAFGFEPNDETLSIHTCVELQNALAEFLDGLPVAKKLNARIANSSKQG